MPQSRGSFFRAAQVTGTPPWPLALLPRVLQILPDATVATDAEGRIVTANIPFETLFGYSIQELVGRPVEMLVPESLRETHRAHRANLVPSEDIWRPMGEPITFPAVRKDGTSFPADISLFSLVTTGGRVVIAQVHDATKRVEHESRLLELASTDSLTGKLNRAALLDRLEQALRRQARHGSRGALLYLDIDGFKHVNDRFGHSAGDAVLVSVAQRLGEVIRDVDSAGRVGGDEFAIVLEKIGGCEEGRLVAERLLGALGRPSEVDGIREGARVSIGIACFPEHGKSVQALMSHADEAMYKAKLDGGARACTYDAGPSGRERC